MALITLSEVEAAGRRQYASRLMIKSAAVILQEDTNKRSMSYEFDVFLSHSYRDAKLDMKRLLGTKAILEEHSLTVYVDWIIDRELDRQSVTEKTAETLRTRMNHSKCLLFATSENSQDSRWMPWELGYMDGQKQRVAILPLVATSGRSQFKGQEYLGVYPYLERAETQGTHDQSLWVCNDTNTYVRMDEWLRGMKPRKRGGK